MLVALGQGSAWGVLRMATAEPIYLLTRPPPREELARERQALLSILPPIQGERYTSVQLAVSG